MPPTIEQLRAEVTRMLATLDQSSPISAIVLFEVDPRREPEFIGMADALTAATRRLAGCNVFSFHKTVKPESNRVEYLIYEDWETVAHFQPQWASTHLQAFQARVGDLIVAPPDLRFYHGWRAASMSETAHAAGPQAAGYDDPSLATSAFRFSWAMGMFGAQQMANVFSPGTAARAMDNVTASAESGLSGLFRDVFRAGDAILGSPRRSQPASPDPPPPPPPSPPPRPSAGPAPGPAAPPPQMGERNISPEYPFAPHYAEVFGSRMHYIEQGSGDPILLIHGNPSWSYSWRNIIPHLSGLGRCIAPDLIGYGRSDKPEIEYHWFDHARYLERFIDQMGLKNVTLVLHDQGSALGFHYAMRHESNIKAIAFFEALVRPFTWENFSTPQFRQLFQAFRSGGVGGQGWQMIVDQNFFIEQLLPQGTGRQFSEREMQFYREPFERPETRLPIWRFPRETAIGGEPKDVWHAVTNYCNRLQNSNLPKLMLYATPGALLTAEHVDWVQRSIPNLTSVDIGPGLHFLDESSPHRIGSEIAAWLRKL